MAWNDPGGRNDDPWSSGGSQGPPDLDEAFRKFQSKLANVFGGGGGGGSTGWPINWKTVSLAFIVLVVAYFAWGLYQLDEQERGVVFRFGAVQEQVKLQGLRWNPPIIDEVRRVNVTRVESLRHQASMLTEDENIVDIQLTVQYRVGDPISFEVEVQDPKRSLEHATESALRHVVGSSTMDAVITEGRAALAIEVEERIQRYLDLYQTGIVVVTVNIDHSQPPRQVQDAFDDVQKAKEDEVRKVNQANAYAEGVVPQARGDAEKAVQEAEAYRDQVISQAKGEAERFEQLLVQYQLAPAVTRDRLYIDAVEAVLSQSSKTIVDVGENNIMMLPLDRSASASPSPPLSERETGTLAGAAREINASRTPTR